MKQKKRKKIRKVALTSLHVLLIGCIACILSIILILSPKLSQRAGADDGYYVPVPVTPNPSSGTMQLQTVQFKFIAFTPTPTLPSNNSSNSSSTSSAPGSAIGQQIASLATNLIANIHKSCGIFVNLNKINCLNGVGSGPVVARLKLNTSQDYNLQCAGFAQAVAIGVGKDIGRGDASTYAGRSIAGYRWISNNANATISVGDITIWSGFGCQHIAVVTQVFGQYSYRVAEANGSDGSVIFENYGRGGFRTCRLQGWQHAL
jgi:hypothetical protein